MSCGCSNIIGIKSGNCGCGCYIYDGCGVDAIVIAEIVVINVVLLDRVVQKEPKEHKDVPDHAVILVQ